jgi:hypothetical protein
MPLIFGLLVIIAVVLVIGWIQDNKEKRRVTALRNEAARLTLEFREEEDTGLLRQTVPFLLFYQGVSSSARNVMLIPSRASDEDQPRVAAFEYTFNVPFGRYVQSWRQTVIQLISPTLSLPAFSVMPEAVFEALATKARDEKVRELALSAGGVIFDDYPLFSEQSHVHALDRTRVRPLFSEALIRFFEGRPNLCVEAGEHTLILYRFDKLTPADELSTFMDEAHEVHRILEEAAA